MFLFASLFNAVLLRTEERELIDRSDEQTDRALPSLKPAQQLTNRGERREKNRAPDQERREKRALPLFPSPLMCSSREKREWSVLERNEDKETTIISLVLSLCCSTFYFLFISWIAATVFLHILFRWRKEEGTTIFSKTASTGAVSHAVRSISFFNFTSRKRRLNGVSCVWAVELKKKRKSSFLFCVIYFAPDCFFLSSHSVSISSDPRFSALSTILSCSMCQVCLAKIDESDPRRREYCCNSLWGQ